VRKLKISCVSYTNSLPYIYGIQKFAEPGKFELSIDNPAECYNKLASGQIDIGLVPVVGLKRIDQAQIISNYCIGSRYKVKSVILCSRNKPENLERIYLDYQSRTSVELVKVLARNHWKISPEFIPAEHGFENILPDERTGLVIIGDRCFPYYKKNLMITDLAQSWFEYARKPFVFACWMSTTHLDNAIIKTFNAVLEKCIESIPEVIKSYKKHFKQLDIEPKEYYYKNINYKLDKSSHEGLELFLNLLHK